MKTIHKQILLVLLLGALLPIFNAAAFYDPHLGRWVNRDPIGERGGINLYAINNNDSVGKIDRLGLATIRETVKVKHGEFKVEMSTTAQGLSGTITFTPNKDCPQCKKVRLVQAARMLDTVSPKKEHVWGDNRDKVRTSGGWFIDHLPSTKGCKEGDKTCSIYYGDYATAIDGSSTSPASLQDAPSVATQVDGLFSAETCARCVDPEKKWLGCVTWGFQMFEIPGVVPSSVKGSDSPSADFNSALDAFNSFYETSH